MGFKKLLFSTLPSLMAMAIWESFKLLLNKIITYSSMEHAGITNFWFILFFISVNLLFFFISIKLKRLRKENKTPTGLKATNSIIAEIENDETAINILLAIKTLEDKYQEDSEVLGQPIRIFESDIAKLVDVSLGITQLWIGKLTKAKFLKEGFEEIYGVVQSGIEFLHKIGRLK